MMTMTAFSRSFLLASAAMIAGPAQAQTAEETNQQAENQRAAVEAQAQAETDANGEEIVVTARRTEESIQRVPSSISAFTERSLDRIQATDTTGLQGAVPNLNIVQGRGSSNATNIFIRGIGQPDALQTFDPAVGVYVDDVYLSRIRGNQLDLLDLERLEVLRGPQGTLYGKNTIGGAIKFVTRKPGDALRANGSITLGSYNQFDLKGAVSGPLSEHIGAGISVMRAKRDGFVQDEGDGREYNDRNTFAGRAVVAITPSDRLRFDLTADYSQDDAKLTVGRPVNNLVQFSGGVLVVDEPVGSGSYDWEVRTTPGLPNSTELKHFGFSGTAAFDLTDEITVKSITAHRNLKTDDYIDIDASQYEVGDVFVGVDQKQTSQEFQLLYTGERLNAVAGLYYLSERIESHQEAYADDLLGTFLGGGTFLRTIDDELDTKSYAAFANASYEIAPTVRLSAGIRFTREHKDYFRTTDTFSSNPLFTSLVPLEFVIDKTWKDTSPMASIDWQATPNLMLYGRVAKGFKSGGFNGRANSASERTAYDPEKALSWEAGFKSRLFGQLTLNGAAFTSTYEDFQARVSGTEDVFGIPTPTLSVLNAGKLKINGAELEAAWTPIDNLLIDTQIGYLDADYKDFDDVRFTSCCGGSRAFQTPAFAPTWTVRLGAQYGVDLGSAGTITLGAQTRHKSRTALAVDNTFVIGSGPGAGTQTEIDALFQKGYWVHDARIVYETANKHWELGLYGNNLSDRAYKTDAQEFSSVGGVRTVYYGAPRTILLKLTARY